MEQSLRSDYDRRISVFDLLPYYSILSRTQSFSESIVKCNFSTKTGWGGKTYVDIHDMDEYRVDMRGVTVLDLYYIKHTDEVVLTQEQCADYARAAAIYVKPLDK